MSSGISDGDRQPRERRDDDGDRGDEDEDEGVDDVDAVLDAERGVPAAEAIGDDADRQHLAKQHHGDGEAGDADHDRHQPGRKRATDERREDRAEQRQDDLERRQVLPHCGSLSRSKISSSSIVP